MKIENIKFKAKRLDNGEWIIGSFVVMQIPALSKTTIGLVVEGGATLYEVAPSTVCQFTGFKDIEGNEVWEGDILDGRIKGEVVFMFGTFALHPLDCNKREVFAPLYYFRLGDKTLDLKVIGNKFDKQIL